MLLSSTSDSTSQLHSGARPLNEESLWENLQTFNIPQTGIESTRSKPTMKILDEYANILRSMYNGRLTSYLQQG